MPRGLYGSGYAPSIDCCPPLFGNCSDGTIGIFNTGGESEAFLRWIGLAPARTIKEEINYLQYMGAIKKGTNTSSQRPGVPLEICLPGDRASYGEPCTAIHSCFGEIKSTSDPIVDGGLPYCVNDIRYTIDGTVITDDEMWHEANVSEAHMNAYAYNLLWGIKDNAQNKLGHYGLWSLLQGYDTPALNFQYECPELKPMILDWNCNDMASSDPMPGITLNGVALAPEWCVNLYATLRELHMVNKRRIAHTKGIATPEFAVGDVAIVGPSETFDCLMETATCYTECGGNCLLMDSQRAADNLRDLQNIGTNVGTWGGLHFRNFTVPFIAYDPTTLIEDAAGVVTPQGSLEAATPGCYHLMMLYRGSGNRRFMQPQFNALKANGWNKTIRDNGLIQVYMDHTDICETMGMRTEWRWNRRGSMFQILIKNVKCVPLMDYRMSDSFTPVANNC